MKAPASVKAFFVSGQRKPLHRSTVNYLLKAGSASTHPHMLRHACGFALADQGADSGSLQKKGTPVCKNRVSVKRVVTTSGYREFPEYAASLRAAEVELVEGESLEGFDGLVLMGGVDVNPALYGEPPDPLTEEPDDARDRLEYALIATALARDLPILGICRGLQILNVQQGGSLVQHIEGHRVRTEDRGLPAHSVEIMPETHLAVIAGSKLKWKVNSRHHQAAARLGNGLVVSARDPRDGTIEAIEKPDKRFVVAVQWHPENQSDMAKLFCAFAAAL